MLSAPKRKRSAGLAARGILAVRAWHWVGTLSEIISMTFKHVAGLLCAAAVSIVVAGPAAAQQKTVKIGAIYPLSGNAASAGVHAKAAIETAVDIINNGHPGLGNLPVTKGPGLPGPGGAQGEGGLADNQGRPAA